MTGDPSSQLPPEVVELMNTLVDVHTPPALSWWPPAIGWWVATILALAVSAYSVKVAIKIIKRKKWHQCLAEELTKIEQSAFSDAALCQHLNQLLKRATQVQFGDEKIQELSGQAWVDYLHSKLATKDNDLDLSSLGDVSYQPTLNIDRQQVINNVRKWMKACC